MKMRKLFKILTISSVLLCICAGAFGTVSVFSEEEEAQTGEVLFGESFEEGVNSATAAVTGRMVPAEWEFSDLRNPGGGPLDSGIDRGEVKSGDASLTLEAVDINSVGFKSPRIYMDYQTSACDVKVYVKSSSDYKNNRAKAAVEFYSGYKLVESREMVFNTSASEWIENTFSIDRSVYPNLEFDNIRIRLFTVFVQLSGSEAAGRIYYDDLSVVRRDEPGELYMDVRCDDSIGWYYIGETVTFKPNGTLPEDTNTVTATVYDSQKNVIREDTVDATKFAEGWSYTPSEVGFYTAGFVAHTNRGDMRIASRYRIYSNQYVLPERSFVVAKPPKPVEERCPILYTSHYDNELLRSSYPMDDNYRMFNEIGFRGVRLHSFYWDSNGDIIGDNAQTAPNPARGLYDFSEYDKVFEQIDKYGLDCIATVQYTPRWASPYADMTEDVVGAVSGGGIHSWSVTPPTRNEYYTEYLKVLAERYGDSIDAWEIWNEMTPGSRWWELGTPEDYVGLIRDSRKVLNEVQPGEPVVMGGLVANSQSYWEKLLDAGLYDYTDAFVIHGPKTNYESYLKGYEDRGLEPKPWWNSEAHFIITNTYSTEIYYTEEQDAMRLMKGYFNELRNGCELIALFQTTTNYNMEILPEVKARGGRGLSYGLWTRHPFPEPRLVAKVANTFFDSMGTDFKYDKEYSWEDGKICGISFMSDGKPMLYVWSDEDDFTICPELAACFNEQTDMVDWEGKSVDKNSTLRSNVVYIIDGIDAEKLGKLAPAEGEVISDVRVTKEYVSDVVGKASKSPLFNKNSFEVSSGVVWNEDNWEWKDKTGSQLDGYDAKYAISADNDGVYLMVEVTDDNINFNGTDPTTLYNFDSIQFAIDVTCEGYSDMYSEFQISLVDGVPTVYKQKAANVNGAVPNGWTTAGAVVQNDSTRITTNGNKILYQMFMPAGELYPYSFEELSELRISLLTNDNDGETRRGLLTWSDGIDGGKDIGKYGKVELP